MRYRDSIQQQLDRVESNIKVLEYLVKRQEPVEKFLQTINELKENLAEAKSYIDREPATMDERGGLI